MSSIDSCIVWAEPCEKPPQSLVQYSIQTAAFGDANSAGDFRSRPDGLIGSRKHVAKRRIGDHQGVSRIKM